MCSLRFLVLDTIASDRSSSYLFFLHTLVFSNQEFCFKITPQCHMNIEELFAPTNPNALRYQRWFVHVLGIGIAVQLISSNFFFKADNA